MLLRNNYVILTVFIVLLFAFSVYALEDNWRHYNLGIQRIQEKNYRAAMNQFSYYIRNVKLHRHMYGIAYFGMGLTHEAKGEYNLAIMKYLLAIENDLHPTVKISEKAYMNLGANYMRTEAYQVAIKAYLRVIKMNANNGLAHYYLGLSYFKNHEYEKAKKEAEEAKRLGITFTALSDKLKKVKELPSQKPEK